MEDENINLESLVDESHVNSPTDDKTVGGVSGDSMTLAELNSALGKNFLTKEAAIKSFKDTFSYVGKKINDVKREVLSEVKADERTDKLAQELAEMRKERFYDRNPQYQSVRNVIEKMGGSPEEVVNSAEFKELFEKVSGYEETQKLKTVLESNPRLSSSRDSLAKAREINAQHERPTDEVESLVANAVKDAYGL